MKAFCLLFVLAFSLLGSDEELIPWTNAGLCWTYEGPRLPAVNKTLYGGKIVIGGQTFHKGIAGHTPFTVFFHTGGLADSLSGRIGIDDGNHPLDPPGEQDTAVDAVILANRREVFRRTVHLGEKAQFFSLNLKGVSHLELRGEYKKHFYKQRIVFADLRFHSSAPEKLRAFAWEKRRECEMLKRKKIHYPPAPEWKTISIRKENEEYVIGNGKICLRLLPGVGGRISGISLLGGENLLQANGPYRKESLLERGGNGDFGGGHFMRPEPRRYFLPSDPILKYAPYTIEFPREGKILMTSPSSPDFLMRYSFLIEIENGKSGFTLYSRIVNTAPFPQKYGIWSVTRIRHAGMKEVIFPDGVRIPYSAEFPRKEEKGFQKFLQTDDAVLTAVWMDGTFLRKEYHESGGRLHLFVNNTFTELEFHTPVYDIGSGNSVELKEVWMIGKTND